MTRLPLTGRAVWYGADLDRTGDWIRTLAPDHYNWAHT